MAFLARVPVEDKFPHLRRLYGPFSQGFDRATTLSIYDGTYDVRVTVDEMINSIVYLFDCHAHFGNLNTSYSFADFELTDSKDDGFTRICEDVVTTNDRVVGYIYSADELANG